MIGIGEIADLVDHHYTGRYADEAAPSAHSAMLYPIFLILLHISFSFCKNYNLHVYIRSCSRSEQTTSRQRNHRALAPTSLLGHSVFRKIRGKPLKYGLLRHFSGPGIREKRMMPRIKEI